MRSTSPRESRSRLYAAPGSHAVRIVGPPRGEGSESSRVFRSARVRQATIPEFEPTAPVRNIQPPVLGGTRIAARLYHRCGGVPMKWLPRPANVLPEIEPLAPVTRPKPF